MLCCFLPHHTNTKNANVQFREGSEINKIPLSKRMNKVAKKPHITCNFHRFCSPSSSRSPSDSPAVRRILSLSLSPEFT